MRPTAYSSPLRPIKPDQAGAYKAPGVGCSGLGRSAFVTRVTRLRVLLKACREALRDGEVERAGRLAGRDASEEDIRRTPLADKVQQGPIRQGKRTGFVTDVTGIRELLKACREALRVGETKRADRILVEARRVLAELNEEAG